MKFTFGFIISTLSSAMAGSILLNPPTVANVKEEIAVVWINGALCSTEAYRTIAVEFQKTAAAKGIKAWVDIPSFIFETPEPVEMSGAVNGAISDLTSAGFPKGNKMFIAAHSLGTVMTQSYLKSHTDVFSGAIYMGGGILRENYINNNSTGLTEIDMLPTLSIAGTKDGLYRISRSAEGFYHQVENIAPQFKDKFPINIIHGGSHGTFMDETKLSSYVQSHDLMPDIPEAQGHAQVAGQIVEFISIQLGNKVETLQADLNEAAEFMAPLIEAMKYEGSYNIRVPCYNISTINPDWPKQCQKGSPFIDVAQVINGGDTSKEGVVVKSSDNFHRCYSVAPHHLPDVTDNKVCGPSDPKPCQLDVFTVSEAFYNRLTPVDTGMSENAALEIKAKLLSTQNIQQHAGVADADFKKLDGDITHCQKINEESLRWGLSKVSKEALERYNSIGKKLVMGADLGPYNIGPLWLWTYMKLTDNADKTETTVQAPMMSTPTNYWEPQVRGFHYCKVFSPYRVVEWVYHDSLKDRDSRAHHAAQKEIIQ